jgi:superfamily II DNA helicase RecQ
VLLLRYFGERKSTPCNGCDVCLQQHQEQVTAQIYNRIGKAIIALQEQGNQDIKSIICTLSPQFDEEQIIKVIRIMRDRGEISC